MNSKILFTKRENINKIRVDSCIVTILEIKKKIQRLKHLDPVFMFQFSELETIIPKLKADQISDMEVERIEKATNSLFDQMKPLYNDDDEVYNGYKH